MKPTAEQIWDAIYRLGAEDGTADRIAPAVVGKLIEFKMATLSAAGLPELTAYGHKCFIVPESGDGSAPELNDLEVMLSGTATSMPRGAGVFQMLPTTHLNTITPQI